MLKYLWDPANAVTTAGLLVSSGSLFLALSGRLELAVAAALWAVLLDHLDGVVAARTKNRDPDVAKMGKCLDGFGDIIYGCVLPAAIVIQLSHASLLALTTASAVLVAGAVRLSYFANFGRSPDGRFLGVPLSYDVPLLALLFLLQPLIPAERFVGVVNICFLLLAAAHVASIRVPSPNTAMYVAITVFAVASSAALASRSLRADREHIKTRCGESGMIVASELFRGAGPYDAQYFMPSPEHFFRSLNPGCVLTRAGDADRHSLVRSVATLLLIHPSGDIAQKDRQMAEALGNSDKPADLPVLSDYRSDGVHNGSR